MDSTKPTVMAPVHLSSFNLFDEMKVDSTTNKYMWRQTVTLWAIRILTYAEGKENREKVVPNTLCLTIYSCMTYGYQTLVNRSVDAGELGLRSNTNTPNDERIETLEMIISVFAKDSVTDSVFRKIKMI